MHSETSEEEMKDRTFCDYCYFFILMYITGHFDFSIAANKETKFPQNTSFKTAYTKVFYTLYAKIKFNKLIHRMSEGGFRSLRLP